jgi:hypothetical protein
MTTNDIIGKIRYWGEQRYITGPEGEGTLQTQLEKAQEELDETKWAAENGCTDEIKDGIGDTAVCLILAAERAGLTFEECLEAAWMEIKDRKGRMLNGKFVKETTKQTA